MISLGGGTTIKVLSLGADFARFKIKIEGNIGVEAGSIRRVKKFRNQDFIFALFFFHGLHGEGAVRKFFFEQGSSSASIYET